MVVGFGYYLGAFVGYGCRAAEVVFVEVGYFPCFSASFDLGDAEVAGEY